MQQGRWPNDEAVALIFQLSLKRLVLKYQYDLLHNENLFNETGSKEERGRDPSSTLSSRLSIGSIIKLNAKMEISSDQKTEQPQTLTGVVSGYQLTVSSSKDSIKFEAFSEVANRMFSAELFNDTLPSSLKERFGECAVIYAVISEEGVLKAASLSDTGILSIPVTAMFGSTKVNNVVSIDLKEGKPSDAYLLKMKVNRLEATIEEMKQVQLSLKAENAQLKESVTALTAETERQRELERRELRKIESQVDTNGPFSNLVRLEGRKLTVPAREGDRYPWFPIYLSREPIRGKRYFEVQMDAVGNNLVMIGIDSIENRERETTTATRGRCLCALMDTRDSILMEVIGEM